MDEQIILNLFKLRFHKILPTYYFTNNKPNQGIGCYTLRKLNIVIMNLLNCYK